jgi:TolB-like protein
LKKNIFSYTAWSAIIVSALILITPVNSFPGDMKTIAIMPFETIASDDITYIQSGVTQMLLSRMAWKDHIMVIPDKTVAELLKTIHSDDKNKQIQQLSKLTGSDYVLTGSITRFSEAFSIDTQIYDIKNKRFMTFFEQSKLLSDLIPKVNFIAARINKKVFNRKTNVYDQLVNKEKEKYEELRRQNPERLMPKPNIDPGEKSSPWKFWQYL